MTKPNPLENPFAMRALYAMNRRTNEAIRRARGQYSALPGILRDTMRHVHLLKREQEALMQDQRACIDDIKSLVGQLRQMIAEQPEVQH